MSNHIKKFEKMRSKIQGDGNVRTGQRKNTYMNVN